MYVLGTQCAKYCAKYKVEMKECPRTSCWLILIEEEGLDASNCVCISRSGN